MLSDKIKVKSAELINYINVAVIGSASDKTISATKFPGATFRYNALGLWIEHPKGTVLVPVSNIKFVLLDE